MNKADIAAKIKCSRSHVNSVLNGKKNPNTKMNKLIIGAAADVHALQCRQEFIAEIEREYNFKMWVKNFKKNNEKRNKISGEKS